MKKLIMMSMILAITGCDSLDLDVQNNQLVEPDHEYEIDTWMQNSEVYEFTPRSNDNYTCVMVMLDSGKDMGLQCFPKPAEVL
jgi:hypothetical protein